MNKYQLQNNDYEPIAPFTLASSVKLSKYDKNLQEQVDFMDIDVINEKEQFVENDINEKTNETIDAIIEAGGDCKENIEYLYNVTNLLDGRIFPLRINYTITLASTTGGVYKETISGNIQEYDDKPSDLKDVTIKKKSNGGQEKTIYNPQNPSQEFLVENIIEGGSEQFTFTVSTMQDKTTSSGTTRYLVFYGPNSGTSVNNFDVKMLSKTLKSSPTYSMTLTTKANTYAWIIIPSAIKITRITSGGIEFSLKSSTEIINIEGFGQYRAYRSNELLQANTWSLDVTGSLA